MRREKNRNLNILISALLSLIFIFTPFFACSAGTVKASEDEIQAVRFQSWDNSARMDYTVNVTAGKIYTLSFLWLSTIDHDNQFQINGLKLTTNNNPENGTVAVFPEGRYRYTFTAESDTVTLTAIGENYPQEREFYFADVQISETDENGRPVEDGEVIDCNSDDFSEWTITNPYGYNVWPTLVKKDFFERDDVNAVHIVRDANTGMDCEVTLTAGKTYTFTALWKYNEGENTDIQLTGGAVNDIGSIVIRDEAQGTAVYNENGEISYTFTASAEDMKISVRHNSYTTVDAYFANPEIFESDSYGNPVEGGESVYIEPDYSKWFIWYSAWGFEYLTLKKSFFERPLYALTDLNVGYQLTPEFDPKIYEYNVDVPNSVSALEIEYTLADNAVFNGINGNENFSDTEINEVIISVTNYKGILYEYVINVKRERVKPEITMLDGASVRYNSPTGLRFETKISGLEKLSDEGASFNIGTLIVPTDYLDGIDFTIESLKESGKNYLDIKQNVWAHTPTEQEPYYIMNSVISDIKESNYNRAFSARTYVDVTYADGITERYYGDYSAVRNTRSVYEVAYKALNDTENIINADQKTNLEGYTSAVEAIADEIMYLQWNAASKTMYTVQKYSEDENFVMVVKPTGVNQLMNIAPPRFVSTANGKIVSDLSNMYERSGAEEMSESDWLGPHYINGTWYGGTHGTNSEQGDPTALCDNIKISVNGKSVPAESDLNCYAAALEITWDNFVGSSVKENALLIEHHVLSFDGATWDVETEIEFLQDVTWMSFYGMQSVYGVWAGNVSYNESEPQRIDVSASGGNSYDTSSNDPYCDVMLLRKDNDCLEMYIDNNFGMGDRRYLNGGNGAFTINYNSPKNGKAYFGLVSGNNEIKAGDTEKFCGYYRFYSTDISQEGIYKRSVVNEGDKTRIANAMQKALNGQPVTVGAIGGSITEGSAASSPDKTYAALIKKWWEDSFPDSEITFINAGKGDTTSLMGVGRAEEDLLCYNPDFVIAEFSVNDTDNAVYQQSYEGLVRKILNSDNQPGLLMLMMMNNTGWNCEKYHLPVSLHYNLPVISYQKALWPSVGGRVYDWGTLSPDTIHPNDFGHSITASLVTNYLDDIRLNISELSGDVHEIPSPLNQNNLENAVRYTHDTLNGTFGSFEENDYTFQFSSGWTATGAGDPMTFTAGNAQNIYIIYYQDSSGSGGTADVLFDGETIGSINSDFTGGWNRSEIFEVLNTESAGTHTVKIVPTSADGKSISISGIIIS